MFKPGFSPSNFYSSLEEGASRISVSETAGFLMIINRIHGCPVFMSSGQIACRNARCRNIWNFTLCTTPLVFNVSQSAAQAFLHNTVSADLKMDEINQYTTGYLGQDLFLLSCNSQTQTDTQETLRKLFFLVWGIPQFTKQDKKEEGRVKN